MSFMLKPLSCSEACSFGTVICSDGKLWVDVFSAGLCGQIGVFGVAIVRSGQPIGTLEKGWAADVAIP